MEKRGHKLLKAQNAAFTIAVYVLTFLTALPLFLVVGYIMINGFRHLSLDLLVKNPAPVGESGGGVLNGIIGSAIIITIAAALGIPIGILGGLYLAEARESRYKHVLRISVEILQGIPSIVIGIVGYLLIVLAMGRFSAIAGGAALAIIMLPVIVINTEEALRLVPNELREAGIALGIARWRVSLFVVLRAGMGGVLSGVLLSISRAAGETAPLLFTALGSQFLNLKITQPMAALPLQIFNYSISPYPEWHALGFAASLLLLIFILSLNIITRTALAKMNYRQR